MKNYVPLIAIARRIECMHGLVFVMHGLTTFLQLTFVPVKISYLLKIYSALLSGASSGVVG